MKKGSHVYSAYQFQTNLLPKLLTILEKYLIFNGLESIVFVFNRLKKRAKYNNLSVSTTHV